MARILPSIREAPEIRNGACSGCAVSGARPPSLAVPGGAPRAGTDATLALAVPHARRTRGMHASPATPADSTLAVAGGAFPVLPAMRTVRRPHGEARRRQQHHQTSRQNETMHHHSLLLAVRLRCRRRRPCTARLSSSGTGVAGRSRASASSRHGGSAHPAVVACNTGSRRGSREEAAGHRARWRPSTAFAPAAPADDGALQFGDEMAFSRS